ncbi:MAG: hypothetical protein AAFY02_13070 [Pseudomonadota bacterium]
MARADTLSLDARALKRWADACVEADRFASSGEALRAWSGLYLGDLDLTERAVEAVIAAQPEASGWLPAYLALRAQAVLEAARGRFPQALDLQSLAAAVLLRAGQSGQESRLLAERAALLRAAGQETDAAETFRGALALAGSRLERYRVLRRDGWSALGSGDYARAYRRLSQAFALAPTPPEALYMALQAYAAQALGLGQETARESLRADVADADLDIYPGLLLRHALGQITEEEVLARAGSESRQNPAAWQAQAGYYLALAELLAGDRAAAAAGFERVLASDVVALPEYGFAKHALAALAPSR